MHAELLGRYNGKAQRHSAVKLLATASPYSDIFSCAQ
jgi:hypothetical protein